MPGKINTSLDKGLKNVEWGSYKLSQLFDKIKVNSLKYKTSEIPSTETDECPLPALTAGIKNQGLNNYVPLKNATILKNVITISANGANTGATFYQSKPFTVLQDAYAIKWIYDSTELTDRQSLFLVGSITKTIKGKYEWTNKAGWEKIKSDVIQLPMRNSKIDFDFMENFIREIEEDGIDKLSNYITVSGLSSTVISPEEEKVMTNFNNIEWEKYNLETLFGKSTRGKRLKSADRIPGKLPFVTAGEADEGVSDFVGNNVNVFQKNTTTIDMFGSAKYRNYEYGADDHIAVVHTEKLSTNAAIFVTTAIHKSSHNGQFDYGRNFYAKDADDLNILLPTKDDKPDFDTMAIFISAIKKLVIKDMVDYLTEKHQEVCYMYNEVGEIDNLKVAEESEEYKYY